MVEFIASGRAGQKLPTAKAKRWLRRVRVALRESPDPSHIYMFDSFIGVSPDMTNKGIAGDDAELFGVLRTRLHNLKGFRSELRR